MKGKIIDKNTIVIKIGKLLNNKNNKSLIKKTLEKYGLPYTSEYENLLLTDDHNEVGMHVNLKKNIQELDLLKTKKKLYPYNLTKMDITEEEYYSSIVEIEVDIKNIIFI